MGTKTKTCPGCKTTKSILDFQKNRARPDGRQAQCTECRNVMHRLRREKIKAKPEDRHRWALWYHFQMLPEEYDSLLAAQGGVCAICGNPPAKRRLSVDHDHQTGRVRELLCGTCNSGLGMFMDNPDLLTAAAAYLVAHKASGETTGTP